MEIKPLQPVPTVAPARRVKRDDPDEKQRDADKESDDKPQDQDAEDGNKRVDTYA